ncbi:polyhydroxyalkanoate depolymerase [Paraburkholderia sp. RL17-373-BIF-A]|uniref:polyhydroxyalkanoate depolymerase n=1 Tax=Paraburkholderia sp. RL17-373-BIF-A TaxID=3031629 RepID=UPI0038BA808F
MNEKNLASSVRPRRGAPIIGEFCNSPEKSGEPALTRAALAYLVYETAHTMLGPVRAWTRACQSFLGLPMNPIATTPQGRTIGTALDLFERATRRYGKPDWNIVSTTVDGKHVPVRITTVWERPFCCLLHFERSLDHTPQPQPRLLIVAPMSGHYATLLRGTVQAFLPTHDVYITEWIDARMVPLIAGPFDLDDYIEYVIAMIQLLGGDVHVMAVCQPSVPVLAAIALMESAGDPAVPHSMILLGGPIDTRINPTMVNTLARKRGLEWFRQNVIAKVPFPNPGFMRDVYPGFLQLYGFMVMNLDRHMEEHQKLFHHLITGDRDSAKKHHDFYDEYLAVMDLCAEFYLQTCDTVFIRHALPKGEMMHRGLPVDPSQIHRVALMTVEGEHDDISGVGQTEAAHQLCTSIPPPHHLHWLQPGVGHYGVFNGSRFRTEIAPRIADFILAHNGNATEPHPS